jgi:hypothetical protein
LIVGREKEGKGREACAGRYLEEELEALRTGTKTDGRMMTTTTRERETGIRMTATTTGE